MPAKHCARGNRALSALLRCVILLFALAMAPGATFYATFAYNISVAEASGASDADTVAVTTTADTVDGATNSFAILNSQPGPDGAISLREAMLAANAIQAGSPLTITFSIAPSDPGYNSASGTWTITLGSALPSLTRGAVLIDGATQAQSPRPPIVLDGYNVNEAAGFSNGITIASAGNTLRQLTLMNFWDNGIVLTGASATDNRVLGCYIGTDAAGSGAQPNGTGIDIRVGASRNMIGGAGVAARNLIAGNNWNSGIIIENPTSAQNIIAGNWIGVDSSGQAALTNTFAGVYIRDGAHDNLIGGAGQGNLISGNDWGINIDGGAANTVAGNIIGLAADGRSPLPNAQSGVLVSDGAHDNLIGGTSAALRNVISSNGTSSSAFGQGIYISGQGSTNNTVQGNFIGVDVSGNRHSGNYRQGILVASDAQSNLIGGTASGAGNVIAYNGFGGIRIDSASNHVAGNRIGVGADGTTPLGNQYNGVRILGDSNVIGPSNLIANNQLSGIMLSGSNTVVITNTIRSNARSGICVNGPNTTISGNTIVGNGNVSGIWPDCNIQGGIVITGTGETRMFSNAVLDNQGAGITVWNGRVNRISTNSISGNSTVGIQLLSGGNGEIAPPLIRNVSISQISGLSCPGCRVEIFTDLTNQGKYIVGGTTAQQDGVFQMPLSTSQLQGTHITATMTDPDGNTSPFALPVDLPHAPPPRNYRTYLTIIMQ